MPLDGYDNAECAEQRIEQIEDLTKERNSLRVALIEVGRAIGCFLQDDVSSDFLANLPEEAKLKMQRFAELEAKVQEQEDELEEANDSFERDLKIWEADCARSLKQIADHCNYKWEPDGASADDLCQYVIQTLEEYELNQKMLQNQIKVLINET